MLAIVRATASISALLKFKVTGSPSFGVGKLWALEEREKRPIAVAIKAVITIEKTVSLGDIGM
jgi:hypothetical protein